MWRPLGPWPAIAAVGLIAVLARLPFLGVGLVPDEGGYAHVASAWSEGARLYHDAWVDRPQGLMLAYRILLQLHDGPLAIRLGAMAAGAAVTLLLVAVGWIAHSPAAGISAACVYALVAVAPRLEGYTLHAELAASVPATAAIVVALLARRRGKPRLLVLAGVLGAGGVLMKQSGFDGLAVAVAIALSGGAAGRGALRSGALVIGGAAATIGAAALHGALLGWAKYWNALVGYRLGDGAPAAERLENLARSLDLAAHDLLPLALLAAAGAVQCLRAGARGLVPVTWLAAALAGFHIGEAYWAHYYVQLIAPLSLLAGIAISEVSSPVLRIAAVAAAIAPATVLYGQLVLTPSAERAAVIPSQRPADRDERVAAHLRRHTTPRERIYVLVSRANVYFHAQRPAPTRYLWHPPLQRIPGAMRDLQRELSGRRPPTLIAIYQPVTSVDPSGRLGRILAVHYRADGRAPPGLPPILVRRNLGDAHPTAQAGSRAT
jgi:hypothetical protein